MRHMHFKRAIVAWILSAGFAIVLFLVIFFIRQNVGMFGKITAKAPGFRCEIVKKFSFSDANALKEWEEKVFKNKVIYKIEKEGDRSYVKASSDKSASALYYKINLDTKNGRPVILWNWRTEKFPAKTKPESLEAENEDDFAARVYVIFPAMFITNSKVLEYVWSETMPVGTTGTSPYSKNIKLIVLRQGIDKDKKWFAEERDIYADYVKLFGRTPEYNVGAIAFMTNTEHTGTAAEAMYDEIEVGYGGKP
jgi:hypothetical protein